MVGGISRTVERDGWRFDIGGHRFFTKVQRGRGRSGTRSCPTRTSCMRPRMSRIFYDGKYFDYPLKASNALRNLGLGRGGPLRRAPTCWARIRPPKDQTNYEGWIVARFGWRLYRTFFKTYTEKVWGVPVSEMPADWAAQRIKNLSLCNADRQRAAAEAEPEGHHLADRGVPVPEVRPRDDVGGAAATWSRPQGSQGRDGDRRSPDPPRGRPGRRGRRRATRRRRAPSTRATTSSRRCRSPSCSRRWTRRSPAEVAGGRRRPALPRLPHRRPRRARGRSASPTTGSTSTTPTVQRRPHPELRLVVAVHGEGRPHLPRPRVLRVRGRRRRGTRPTRSSSSGASASSSMLGLVEAAEVEAGYVVRMPKAYPFYDERYKANVDVAAGWLGRARPQRAPGRPQRHAPVQQPGPLDVHGDAHRREHRRRHRTTTSGR